MMKLSGYRKEHYIMANKQIKDFPKNTNIADTDLFLKSTTDGGLSTVDFGTLKNNIIQLQPGVKIYASNDFNPSSITIKAKNNPWGMGILYADKAGMSGSIKGFSLRPDSPKITLHEAAGVYVNYNEQEKTYTITNLANSMATLMITGPLAIDCNIIPNP